MRLAPLYNGFTKCCASEERTRSARTSRLQAEWARHKPPSLFLSGGGGVIVVRVGPHRSPHTREPLDIYMYHGVVLPASILRRKRRQNLAVAAVQRSRSRSTRAPRRRRRRTPVEAVAVAQRSRSRRTRAPGRRRRRKTKRRRRGRRRKTSSQQRRRKQTTETGATTKIPK